MVGGERFYDFCDEQNVNHELQTEAAHAGEPQIERPYWRGEQGRIHGCRRFFHMIPNSVHGASGTIELTGIRVRERSKQIKG